MAANLSSAETDLPTASVALLRTMLPATWQVDLGQDGNLFVRAPNGTVATVVVEARDELPPRDASALLTGISRSLRKAVAHVPVLVVAPWLSPRTREVLAAEQLNFLDLTGNVRVALDQPMLFISATGAQRPPERRGRGAARVRGPKAGRLIRTLVDVAPPYGVRELAAQTGLAAGYVSRLLGTLDREALVDRSERGAVTAVDRVALLRRWAEDYDVLRSNAVERFIAPAGALEAQAALSGTPARVAITGSFAATRLVQVAAPALLLAYADEPSAVADALGLVPVTSGADVVLLRPFDEVVWSGLRHLDGLDFVAPSQIAVDCLTGVGRMPAEGEAVLSWIANAPTGTAR